MTARELIEKLQAVPPETPVIMRGYWCNESERVPVTAANTAMLVHDAEYDYYEDTWAKPGQQTTDVIILLD